MNSDRACRSYRSFLEGLSPAGIHILDDIAVPHVKLRDPFNDAYGVEEVKKVFLALFEDVDAPRFTVTHSACSGNVCFFRWHFTCRPRLHGKGHPWLADGVTEIHFTEDGRIIELVDYWDAGRYVYERIPVLRLFIRWLRKRLRTVGAAPD
ncbi:MAG: nuclear transport factor 2 family protein [Rhodospirillales bacterium]|nr:nuclear transport factor 2 family protein [Rhodospirillales bacterium]